VCAQDGRKEKRSGGRDLAAQKKKGRKEAEGKEEEPHCSNRAVKPSER
jgi:hypothetical protein